MDLTVDHKYWRQRMSERNSAQSKVAVPVRWVRKTKANRKKGEA